MFNKQLRKSNNIYLVIDSREGRQEGADYRHFNEIPIMQRQLSIGDFIWLYIDPTTKEEFVLPFIIERKSFAWQ